MPNKFAHTSSRVAFLLLLQFFCSQYVVFSQTTTTIKWGIHQGPSSQLNDPFDSQFASDPTTNQTLMSFDGTALVNSTASNYEGDLVELGIFADLGDDGAIGGSGSNQDDFSRTLFQGTWLPLTAKTFIGQDFDSSDDVPAGEFYFSSQFQKDTDWKTYVNENDSFASAYSIVGSPSADQPTNLQTILTAIESDGGSIPLGIRFYDTNTKSSGTTRFNTIMNSNWLWPGNGNTEEMWLHDPSTPDNLDSNLLFEFDNTTYGDAATYTAKVGGSSVSTHGTAGDLHSDDFKTSIAYWDGSSSLDISATNSDTVLSGLSSSGSISGGNDNILTLNVNGLGSTANSYTYSGNVIDTGATGGLQILKTGSGEQIITGAVSLASDADSYLTLSEGTLTLQPASASSQTVEYLTGAAGTTLKLDNTNAGTGTIIEFGLANTTTAKTFSGNVELSGSSSAHQINVASGATDYSKEQILAGTITSGDNAMTLVKDGAGRLTLHGDSSSTMGAGITVNDGTLVIGDGSDAGADPGTGTITIEKGKLEIAAGESITNTIAGSTTSSKSMIGGKGTVNTVTIGDASGEVDYISPGRGISSSLTPSQKGVDFDASTDSIGTLTVGTLNWNSGGVFDWQIKDFDPSGGTAGTDWDKLNFTTLNFESGQTFDINILAVQNDGTAGNVSKNSNTWNEYATSNGFLFLQGTTVNNLSDGDVTSSFNIRSNDFNYQIGHYYGDWGVYKSGGNFYLTYSAVPEPSTYFMVTGLFLIPGIRWLRRFGKGTQKSSES